MKTNANININVNFEVKELNRETLTNKTPLELIEMVVSSVYGFKLPLRLIKHYPYVKGCYVPELGELWVNTEYEFKSDAELIETLVHEYRHAWQHKNNYLEMYPCADPSVDFNAYFFNPLEMDARQAEVNFRNRRFDLLTVPTTMIDPEYGEDVYAPAADLAMVAED